METMIRENYTEDLLEQQEDVRSLVKAGLEQIDEGKTSDFYSVCDRLEKKYLGATI